MNRVISGLLAVGLIVNASGCATFVKGTHQSIGITSDPAGAYIKADGIDKGKTPMVIKMKRNKAHTVQFDMPGYKTFEAGISTHSSGWIWGNIFIGGLIGLVVDLITGASNNLVPDNIHAKLTPADTEGTSR